MFFLSIVSKDFEWVLNSLKDELKGLSSIEQISKSLSIKEHITSSAQKGPFGSITTYSDQTCIIRFNFMGAWDNPYIEIDFLKRFGKTQNSVKKVLIKINDGNITISNKQYDRKLFYNEFVSGLKIIYN